MLVKKNIFNKKDLNYTEKQIHKYINNSNNNVYCYSDLLNINILCI